MSVYGGGAGEEHLPEEEIWVGHEVGDALEHASRFEDECWEGNFVKIHADSNRSGSAFSPLRHPRGDHRGVKEYAP